MGKQLPSIINRAGIAVAAMCFPQCFLSVGYKFYIVDCLMKKKEKSFFHILAFLLYVNIFFFFFLRHVIIGVSPQRDCNNFSPPLPPCIRDFEVNKREREIATSKFL